MMYDLPLGKKARGFTDVSKADEKSHTVFGVVVDEVPDYDGEVCDYEPTARYYKEWSNSSYQVTSQSGQEISYGNVRLQHTMEIAGKVIKLLFDDENKKIYTTTKPLDGRIWDIVWGGYVTGYSQGGLYAYRICGECGGDCGEPGNNICPYCKKKVLVHYACKPAEISYVDKSSIPTASFLAVKSDGVHEIRKSSTGNIPEGGNNMATTPAVPAVAEPKPLFNLADIGNVIKLNLQPVQAAVDELQKKKNGPKTKRVAGEDLPSSAFAYVGDPDEVGTWHYPIKFSTEEKTKSHIRNALSQWRKPKGQSSIPSGERSKVYAKIVAAARRHDIEVSSETKSAAASLRKDMTHVSNLAEMLMAIRRLQCWVEAEGNWENDPRDAEIGEALHDWISDGILILKDLVDEESDELVNPPANKAASTEGGITMNELEKAARARLSHHFKKAAAHQREASDLHKALADEHAAHEETCKAVASHHKALADSHKAVHAHLAGNPEQAILAAHHKAAHESHTELHGGHTAKAAHHKAKAAIHMKLHKCYGNMAAHSDKMCAAHESEENMKAMDIELAKAAGIDPAAPIAPVAAAPVAPVVPVAPAATLGVSLMKFEESDMGKAFKALTDTMVEIKGALSKSLAPPAASSAPASIIDRQGNNLTQQSSDDTGL